MKTRLLVAVLVMLAGSIALADDWPGFRGADRTGVSKEKGLLRAWPKGGPTLAWTFKDAGLGHSSVAVVKGVVYTLGTDKDDKGEVKDEIIIALDEKTGAQLWTAKIGPVFTFKGNTWGDGPRSTPTIDGNFLYALGGQGDLVCVDLTSKKEVWRKNLIKDFNGKMMTIWGYSESPLIDGDRLICTPGGKDGTVAALDKKTGGVLWRSKDWPEAAPYSSVVVAEIHGVRQYIQNGFTGGNKGGSIAGVDAKTGKFLWKEQLFTGENQAIGPTPIVTENLVYITVGYGGGCHLFAIDVKQKSAEQYKNLKSRQSVKNAHGGVVLVGDHIYGHTEPQGWTCQELKTGDKKWLERNELKCTSGSITAADGMLYLYTDDGKVGLVEATPNGFNLVSSFTIPQKSTIPDNRKSSRQSGVWAHPVIANGRLYLRDHEFLFAFQVTEK